MKNAPGALAEATNLGIFLDVLGAFLLRPNGTSRYSTVNERKPIITDFYTIVEGLD